MIDYTAMTGPELLAALGTDATKWADAFVQCYEQNFGKGYAPPVDWVGSWFANAMMAQYDELRKADRLSWL